jgi:hypothetical protein
MSFAAATNCERLLRPTEAAAEPPFRDRRRLAHRLGRQALLLETMLAMPSQETRVRTFEPGSQHDPTKNTVAHDSRRGRPHSITALFELEWCLRLTKAIGGSTSPTRGPFAGLAGCNSIGEWTRPKVFTLGWIVWL